MNVNVAFPTPVKYVGLWWLMGSDGNEVRFRDTNNQVVATMDTDDILDFLGVSGSSLTNSDTGTVARVDGGTHLRKRYFRDPGAYTGTVDNPEFNYEVNNYANEPWVYLNLFVSGDVQIKYIDLVGLAFEFDNLTVSTQESGPTGSMVLVENLLSTPPAPQIVSWNPSNTADSSTNASHTPSQAATVTTPNTGGGAISYSVASAGSSGCTVNSSSGVITRTAIGDCRVRATAASVPGSLYSAFKEVTFSFSSAPLTTATPTPTPTTAPASTAPAARLATTGANLEWLMVAGLLAVIAGSSFLAFSRRKRIW
jgi:LPXTG-motif cell wall-anchored protein